MNDASVTRTSVKDSEKDFEFVITTPFTSMHCAASTTSECDSWMDAIKSAVVLTRSLPRGYVTKKGSFLDGGNKRKFVIMRSDSVTYHQDHDHIGVNQGRCLCNHSEMKSLYYSVLHYRNCSFE